MNVGRYLRGEDRHVGTARIVQVQPQSLLDGDGRQAIQPMNVFPGTRPIPVRRAAAKLMIAHLLRTRQSMHSFAGGTLWVVLTYCLETKTKFKLHVFPGEGYFVELK